MCGCFAQYQTCEKYLEFLNSETEFAGGQVVEPIGRYNVAPGTRVQLLNRRDDKLHPDPVL